MPARTDAEVRLAWLEERLREAGVTVMADGSVHVASRMHGTVRAVPERPKPKPVLCRIGWHSFDASSGLGPCLRPGCDAVRVIAMGGVRTQHMEKPGRRAPRDPGVTTRHP